jgi:hypothetical protein
LAHAPARSGRALEKTGADDAAALFGLFRGVPGADPVWHERISISVAMIDF